MNFGLLSLLFFIPIISAHAIDMPVADNEKNEARDAVQEFIDAIQSQDKSDLEAVATARMRNRFSTKAKMKDFAEKLNARDLLIGNPVAISKYFAYKDNDAIGYRFLKLEILQQNKADHRYKHLVDATITCEYSNNGAHNIIEAFTGYDTGDHVKYCQVSDIR